MVNILEERAGDFKNQIIGVSHADDAEKAQELVEMIKSRLGFQDFIVNKIGSVLRQPSRNRRCRCFLFNKSILNDVNLNYINPI